MLFVTIRIRLICQKLDLIETESETYKSQMFGHNAEQPTVLSYRDGIRRKGDKIGMRYMKHGL